MSRHRSRGRDGATALLLLLACIPCCLPLLVLVGGTVVATTGAALASGQAWLAGFALVVSATAAALGLFRRRRHAAASRLPHPLPLHVHDDWSVVRRPEGVAWR